MAHVEKRGPRKYRGRYRGPDGKERSQTFTTEREAKQWLATVEVSKSRGEWVDPKSGRVLFGTYWAEYWQSARVNLRPTTRDLYERSAKNHVLPTFGDVPLGKIDRRAIKAWITELSETLAPSSVQKCVHLVGKTLAAAVDDGLLPASPAAGIAAPTVKPQEMRFLTAQELHALADVIDPRYRALILLGGYSGLRIGEMFGLRWGRVDLLRRQVAVLEIVVDVSGVHHFGEPKTTRGRRTVPIPNIVLDALVAHGPSADRDALVFPAPDGGPVRQSNWRRRFWQPAVVDSGLDPDRPARLTPHSLRHTAVALWIAAGASPVEIAQLAGHASASLVLDRYGHLLPAQKDTLVDRLDQIADNSRPDRGLGEVVALPRRDERAV